MGSASTHRVDSSDRVQCTVAELLGRYGDGRMTGSAGHRSPAVDSVPAGWPTGNAPLRRRLTATAGVVVTAGSIAVAAVLCHESTHSGGPMGSEAAGAGHPVEGRPARPPRAAAPARPVAVTPLARVTRVEPAPSRPVSRAAPAPREVPDRLETPEIPDERTARTPAGSALSGLTPVIGPVETLGSVLGGLVP